jgi:hypothetical protein
MINPWYKLLTAQPANSGGRRRILEVHLDSPLGALAEGLENLALAVFSAGGVMAAGTVSVSGTVLSVSARLGITLDGSAALASGGQTLDLFSVPENNRIRAYLQAAPIPQDTVIIDPDTSQTLTHTTYLRLGKLAFAQGATLPDVPTNAVPVAKLTRVPGGVTLDEVETPGPKLRKVLEGSAPLDFPSIPAGGIATLTMAIAGAQPGSEVLLGAPASLEAGLLAFGLVTAADTVTVRLYNSTAAAVDPAPATWKASVLVH